MLLDPDEPTIVAIKTDGKPLTMDDLVIKSSSQDYSLRFYDPSRGMEINCEGKSQWIIKVTPEGQILFNKEAFPDWEADDFAKAFVDIIEELTGFNCFTESEEK